MKKRIGIGLAVITLVACALAGWKYGAAAMPEERFGDLDRLRTAIAEAKQVRILEGLPHQHDEYEVYSSELANKSTTERMGYPFYEASVTPSAEDADSLTALMLENAHFTPFRGEKKCGGFHLDFAVEWTTTSGNYAVLFCFGCGEIKAEGPGVLVRCDFKPDSAPNFSKILKQFEKQRPPGPRLY